MKCLKDPILLLKYKIKNTCSLRWFSSSLTFSRSVFSEISIFFWPSSYFFFIITSCSDFQLSMLFKLSKKTFLISDVCCSLTGGIMTSSSSDDIEDLDLGSGGGAVAGTGGGTLLGLTSSSTKASFSSLSWSVSSFSNVSNLTDWLVWMGFDDSSLSFFK